MQEEETAIVLELIESIKDCLNVIGANGAFLLSDKAAVMRAKSAIIWAENHLKEIKIAEKETE